MIMSSSPQKSSSDNLQKSSSEELSKEDVKTGRDTPPESEADESSSDDDEIETEVPEEETVDNGLLDSLIHRLMIAKAPETPTLQPEQTTDSEADNPRKHRLEPAPIIPVTLGYDEMIKLCDLASESFLRQKSLIRLEKKDLPVMIAGDMHGQFRDLRSIFARCGAPQIQTYLFLGDYVDRGVQGIEVITLLLALKCKYPTKVYLLRGNHEDGNTCMSYGFYDEVMERYLLEDGGGEPVYKKFLHVFNCIPLAALIDGKILACHGGISPNVSTFDDVEKIIRPAIIPPFGPMCDLVWSDPDDKNDGWALNPRGISFTFSSRIVEEFCKKLNIDLVIRAHQLTAEMIRNGYKFFANGRLVTIFSAPNYLNMRNDACVIRVSKKLKCRFIVFRTQKKGKTRRKKR